MASRPARNPSGRKGRPWPPGISPRLPAGRRACWSCSPIRSPLLPPPRRTAAGGASEVLRHDQVGVQRPRELIDAFKFLGELADLERGPDLAVGTVHRAI